MSIAIIFIKLGADILLLKMGKTKKVETLRPAPTPRGTVDLRVEAAGYEVAKETATAPTESVQVPLVKQQREHYRKKIGEILLEHKLISRETLDQALEHQKNYGGSVTQFLLHKEIITEKQLAECL